MTTITEAYTFQQAVRFNGGITTKVARTELAQNDLQTYALDMLTFVIHDAPHNRLPSAAASNDLGLLGTTFGTNSPYLSTGDQKANGGATSFYARFTTVLPMEYVDGQTVTIRASAGMATTAADTTATLDLVVHSYDRDITVSADLCSTAAIDINSVGFANRDFTITPATLTAGMLLDCRLDLAINDAATGTTVEGQVAAVELLCDVQG